MIALILSLLLPVLGNCQGNPFYNSDFSGGLNTYSSSLILQPNESPDLQNVLVDKSGSLDRRQGYSKLNASTIGNGSQDVNNVFYFKNNSGTDYCLGFSGSTGTYSTDGCKTFTTFVSTLTAGNDVNCDALNNAAFCVNNQYNFEFNGAANSTLPITTMPSQLQYIRVFNNQCFGAGAVNNLSRLYYSNVNDCTTWNTTTQYVDIAPNNGDQITGIGQALYGGLPIYKKYSTWFLTQVGSSGNGPVFQVINISPNVGAKNHRSIQTLFTEQMFDSVGPNGGQPGVYAFNGIQVYEKSKKIRGSFDLLDTFTSSLGNYIINTPAQFNLGNLCVTGPQSCVSTVEPIGSISVSTTVFEDNTTAFFSSGNTFTNIDTSTLQNSIQLTSTTFSDSWSNNKTIGSLNWTVTAGGWTTASSIPSGISLVTSNGPAGDFVDIINTSSVAFSSGSWTFDHAWTSGGGGNCGTNSCFEFRFKKKDATNYYAANYNIAGAPGAQLIKNVAGTKTVLTSGSITNTSNLVHHWNVVSSTAGNNMYLYVDSVFIGSTTDTSLSGPYTATEIASSNFDVSQLTIANDFANFLYYDYNTPATFLSREFDTSFSTPTYGQLSSTFTVLQNNEGQVIFYTQVSTSPNNDVYDSKLASSDTLRITSAAKRYIRYEADITTYISTKTPSISDVKIIAATTGTWKSAEIYTSNKMSAGGWGLFSTISTMTGNASMTYAVQVATYIGGSKFSSVVPVTAGSVITASTGDYVTVIATFTVTSSSEIAQVSNITLNWSQGVLATSPASSIFQNRYHYCCQSKGGSYNDTCYVLDTNNAWFLWNDMTVRSLGVVNQNLIMGGAANTGGYGNFFQLYVGDSDNGGAINAYYNTKDYAFTDLSHYKSIERAIVGYASNATSLTMDLIRDTNQQDYTYTINMSTGAAFGVDYRTVNPPLNGNTFRMKLSNNAANAPWRVLGYGMLYSDKGVMPPF